MPDEIALNSYAGLIRHPVEVVGETPKKYRVKNLSPNGALLPGRRRVSFGDVVLVPKDAVRKQAEP